MTTGAETTTEVATAARGPRSLVSEYAGAVVVLGSVVAFIVKTVAGVPAAAAPEAVIAPMVGLFALTAVVWFAMLVIRNTAVVTGRASVKYYTDYRSDVPDERIERPARTFNNLMQAPQLFYVACILMLVTKHVDEAQVTLAWTFVVLRGVHAAVYATVNRIPYRFAAWNASFVTLCVIWWRFAMQAHLG